MFSASYYFSYKKALEDFNKSAVKRNDELILSLENKGLIVTEDQSNNQNESNNQANADTNSGINDDGTAVDTLDTLKVLPTTKYTLQIYDMATGEMEEDVLPTPSYLIGLNRNDVMEYLNNYMEDLPWNEYQKGLTSFELQSFSEKDVVIRKTYNPDLVESEYFMKSVDGSIVVFYSDQKTVYEYTSISTEHLTDDEKSHLEEGYYIKDLDELYAILEDYSS